MKKAIVIGASSGIGREVARLLIADEWTLGIAARREDQLLALKAEVEHQHPGCHVEVMRIDVTEAEATQHLRQLIIRLGGMDLFFYASAIGKVNRELREDIEQATIDTNCQGFVRMVGEAYRYFAEVGKGHIAAISSIAGTMGLGPAPAYSASKALQATYLEALEQQATTRKLNIHITDIRPGFVDTALLGDDPYPMKLRPERVAQEILHAIRHKNHVRIVDWRYRLLTPLWRCLPRWVWRRLPL